MIWVAFLIGLVLGILAGFEIQWQASFHQL